MKMSDVSRLSLVLVAAHGSITYEISDGVGLQLECS